MKYVKTYEELNLNPLNLLKNNKIKKTIKKWTKDMKASYESEYDDYLTYNYKPNVEINNVDITINIIWDKKENKGLIIPKYKIDRSLTKNWKVCYSNLSTRYKGDNEIRSIIRAYGFDNLIINTINYQLEQLNSFNEKNIDEVISEIIKKVESENNDRIQTLIKKIQDQFKSISEEEKVEAKKKEEAKKEYEEIVKKSAEISDYLIELEDMSQVCNKNKLIFTYKIPGIIIYAEKNKAEFEMNDTLTNVITSIRKAKMRIKSELPNLQMRIGFRNNYVEIKFNSSIK